MLKAKYYKIFILVSFVLALCGFSKSDNEKNAQDKIRNTFAAMQSQYFQEINLSASPQALRTLPTFSVKWNDLADLQRAELLANSTISQADKELAGLIFIYDAMMTVDGLDAVMLQKLSLTDFEKAHRFAKPGATAKEELKTRIDYALSELKSAAKLRPEDRRIDGWIQGAQAVKERIETGKISKQTQEAVMKAIPIRPTFNLWTALIVLHNEDAASLGALATVAKNFVDVSSGSADPCKTHPQDCLNGPKAPYNFQGAVVELGDIFLRRSEYYLQKGDMQNAMIMAQYAEGTYAQLTEPQHAAQTKSWPAREIITLRKNRLAQIVKKQVPEGSLVTMKQYQQAYECGSCHSK